MKIMIIDGIKIKLSSKSSFKNFGSEIINNIILEEIIVLFVKKSYKQDGLMYSI